LSQDYPAIEHIIIDDGSNDGGATVDILRRYPHLRWWSRPNKGAYSTINEGLSATTGDLVTIICADDRYASSGAISAAVKPFMMGRRCDAVYGETIFIGEDGALCDLEGPRSGPLWMFRYHQVATHCSLLVKRDKVIDSGLFLDEAFPYAADFDWIMRMIHAGYRFRRLHQPVAMFRVHPKQRSRDVSPERVEEVQLLRSRYGAGNRVVRFTVRQWVRSVVLRNLLMRRGVAACAHEIGSRMRMGPLRRTQSLANPGDAPMGSDVPR
jgi:glycosyltransferase involved in cell wall biosynthesis